jgi:hypothetical protein
MPKHRRAQKYLSSDGSEPTPEDLAILDFAHARWRGQFQLRVGFTDEGPEYHLCTRRVCVEFNDLASLKEFLGEQAWH